MQIRVLQANRRCGGGASSEIQSSHLSCVLAAPPFHKRYSVSDQLSVFLKSVYYIPSAFISLNTCSMRSVPHFKEVIRRIENGL